MKLPFRQGIVRYQTDTSSNPVFLQKSNAGATIDLIVSPDPTVLTFAQNDADYLFEERTSISEAWIGFTGGIDYWLYWDINIISAERTFGNTTIEPIYQALAPTGTTAIDQHWFNTSTKTMQVWNGITWITVIRVFACKYDEGAIIQPYGVGTQVGLNNTAFTGFILFDDEDKPIRKSKNRGRGEFLTTESVLATHTSKMINVVIESLIHVAQAKENIPAYTLVAYTEASDEIQIATPLLNTYHVVGIVQEDFYTGEITSFTSGGYVINLAWDWTDDPSTPLFCSNTGTLTTEVPQIGNIQRIGEIVSSTQILLNIQLAIHLDEA